MGGPLLSTILRFGAPFLVLLMPALGAGPVWRASAQTIQTPRARDLGVPFEGRPGPLNAITDVAVVASRVTSATGQMRDGASKA